MNRCGVLSLIRLLEPWRNWVTILMLYTMTTHCTWNSSKERGKGLYLCLLHWRPDQRNFKSRRLRGRSWYADSTEWWKVRIPDYCLRYYVCRECVEKRGNKGLERVCIDSIGIYHYCLKMVYRYLCISLHKVYIYPRTNNDACITIIINLFLFKNLGNEALDWDQS